jgi:hypothetical protein
MSTPVDTLIAAATARNQTFTDAAIQASRDVMTAANGQIFAPAGYIAQVPALRGDPPVFQPNTDLANLFVRGFQEAFDQFNPEVLQAVLDYTARFFPAALATVCDDWIQNAIVNGGTGIPAAIENAIWERARSRELIEARRLEQEAVNAFAARGFSLPPGALAARQLEIQQDAANKSSTIVREQAIKSAEIEIENIRFAIGEGLKIRLGVIQGIPAYINAWLKPADESVEYAKALAYAKERLWSTAADYYRAMISEAELGIRAQDITRTSRDQMVGYDVQSFGHHVQAQVSAALAVAQQLGQAAAGALNALGISVQQAEQKVGSLT